VPPGVVRAGGHPLEWDVSEPSNPDAVSLEQQLQYARDLRRVYDSERARRRELEEANRALAAANAELDRRLYDLMAAQEWILAVNSSRELPALMDLLAEPLLMLLRAQESVVFPWDPVTRRLGSALGLGGRPETPLLAALRTSPLSAAVLAAGQLREIADLAAERPTPPAPLPLREGGEGRSRPAQPASAPPLPWEGAARNTASAAGLGGVGHLAAAQELGWRALVALPLGARGERVGLLYVAWSEPHQTDERERMLLDLVGQHAAVSLANARLLAESAIREEALHRAEQQQLAYARDLRRAFEAERARRDEVQAAYLTTVKVLAAAIETRDPYTGGHVERVAAYSVAIGRALGWEGERLATLEMGAALHDVGKIGIEDSILRKPGRLDDDEWAQMRQHPEMGARLLEQVPFLIASVGCALRHHERYDGEGYPDGMLGDDIPIEARVVAVADTFDAMTSDRPYRAGLPASVALAEIERCAGTQFDPEVVAAFLRAVQADPDLRPDVD
jgi:HD-GYP domain-containing protein (c-di-GMP phosphodiesterase class II)